MKGSAFSKHGWRDRGSEGSHRRNRARSFSLQSETRKTLGGCEEAGPMECNTEEGLYWFWTTLTQQFLDFSIHDHQSGRSQAPSTKDSSSIGGRWEHKTGF